MKSNKNCFNFQINKQINQKERISVEKRGSFFLFNVREIMQDILGERLPRDKKSNHVKNRNIYAKSLINE